MDAAEPPPEVLRVVRWRYKQAHEQLHVPRLEAKLFAASDGDLGQLRELVNNGCDPRLAALIVM